MGDHYPCSSHGSRRTVRLSYAQGTSEFNLILFAENNLPCKYYTWVKMHRKSIYLFGFLQINGTS